MKRKSLYWVNGEYVTARKAKRIQKRTGLDCYTFRKTVYRETLAEKMSKFVPWLELACVFGIAVCMAFILS